MIRMELKGADLALKRLQALALTPQKTRRILGKAGRQVARASKKRITAQRDLEGAPFAPRGNSANRRKMLLAFRRKVRVRIEGGQAVIFVGGGILGQWAREHQEGLTQVVTQKIAEAADRKSRRSRKRGASEGKSGMATRRQAKRLRELGWTKSQRWIMATYTVQLAGYLIRKEEGRSPKKSWTITVPARPFLGASAHDRVELVKIIQTELKGRP